VAPNLRESTHFSMERGNENHELGTGFFVHKRIISAVKRVELISDRMSYIILRGRWCYIPYFSGDNAHPKLFLYSF
jgi:hypothetical protein